LVPLLIEVATLAPLLDQLDDQLQCPGEGLPDLGLAMTVGHLVEILDGRVDSPKVVVALGSR
jgi:hypothetical protein